MAKRKGMAQGEGSGYKNIIPLDPKVHSDSAKGMKQPQVVELTKQSAMKGKEVDIEQILAEDEPQPTKTQQLLTKGKAGLQKASAEAFAYAKEQLKKRSEAAQKRKIAELEEVNNPLVQKLSKQQQRIDELQRQISMAKDEDKEAELFDELGAEQEQLRDLQEQVTEVGLSDYSDSQLKTLAVRYQPSWFNDLIGFGTDNPYTKELVRRVKVRKDINQQIVDAQKEKKEESMFGDFFKP